MNNPSGGGPRGGGPGGPGGGRGPGGPGGGRGPGGPGGRGRGRGRRDDRDREPKEFEERVLKINRCAKVVKGGRRFSFSALVVIGDRKGRVGVGFGKANEVPSSVDKAVKDARKNLIRLSLKGTTIPHEVVGVFRASSVQLLPASPGTGIIAGAAVRAVAELAGVKDLLTKSLGNNNPVNLVKAGLNGFTRLRNIEDIERVRGVRLPRPAVKSGKKKAEQSAPAAAATGTES